MVSNKSINKNNFRMRFARMGIMLRGCVVQKMV